ncbi:hypothetical protein [Georhizobium profundi]|nr:hypothetical protein [Georhizobium profundi]
MPTKRKNPHPHVDWRDGRPRFSPAKTLRALGYVAQDLKHADGRWFSRGEAVDWSVDFCRKLAADRHNAKRSAVAARTAPKKIAPTYPLGRLFEDWYRSPKFGGIGAPASAAAEGEKLKGGARKPIGGKIYTANTIRDFKQKARVIESHDPDLWASEVDALDRVICYGLYEDLWQTRGLATARGAMATLSAAISWGLNRGKFKRLKTNPALGLGMATPEPRVRFASRAELETLVAVADHMGRPELGDMFTLAVWTGQRQADRLELVDRGLVNGRRVFRQAKTGAVVAIKEPPELARRLKAAQERRQAAGIVSPHVILNEQTWQPFGAWPYRRMFRIVQEQAVKGVVDENGRQIIAPCPTLEGFWEMDFRDTAVVWMALAGATIPEITSVTGHSLASATQVLKHYLARHPEMADNAIGKMMSWYDDGGETETGL